jgi:ribosomal protein S18 acetylase RimI-like enzyme
MPLDIRPLVDADVASVVALWAACGLTRPWNDPLRDIERARATWPDLLLVAVDGDDLVGTVMAGYDGHRGWLYYLASAPDRRGEGIGRALVEEAERRLVALGCPKVMLMVRESNTGARAFYDTLDYAWETSALAGKRLIADD